MAYPLDIWIARAEKNWLHALYAHVKEVFGSCFLPSHDHAHHLRVWNLSKQLMHEIAAPQHGLTPDLVEGVLIASMFHDLGMAQSTREDHGRLGRELCQSWFSENGHSPPAEFESILAAIELHDTKEARIYPEAGTPPGILGILSVADDLEAMGIIGVYRYAEIYLLREIPLELLGSRVLENAEKRIRNLTSSGSFAGVMEEYQQQFEELMRFYTEYTEQWLSVEDPETVTGGQLGVIHYIRKRSLEGKVRPEDLSRNAREEGKAPIIQEFFSKLKDELEKERR